MNIPPGPASKRPTGKPGRSDALTEFRLRLMKTPLIFGTLLGLALPLHAQLFSNESITGAALGGIAGGVIGHNHHRQTAEGAAIGAGAGFLLGTLAHRERSQSYQAVPAPPQVYAPPSGPVYYARESNYAGPSRAVGGAVLGGVIGGVIGHNHHRQTAEGAAIGAGAGLVLGHLADRNAARRRAVLAQPEPYYPGQTVVAVPGLPPMPPGTVVHGGSADSAPPPSAVVVERDPELEAEPGRRSIGRRPFGTSETMRSANRLFGR